MRIQQNAVSMVASAKRVRQGNARFSSTSHLKLKQQKVAFNEAEGMSKTRPMRPNKPQTFCNRNSHFAKWEREEFADLSTVKRWQDMVSPGVAAQFEPPAALGLLDEPETPKRKRMAKQPLRQTTAQRPNPEQCRRLLERYRVSVRGYAKSKQ